MTEYEAGSTEWVRRSGAGPDRVSTPAQFPLFTHILPNRCLQRGDRVPDGPGGVSFVPSVEFANGDLAEFELRPGQHGRLVREPGGWRALDKLELWEGRPARWSSPTGLREPEKIEEYLSLHPCCAIPARALVHVRAPVGTIAIVGNLTDAEAALHLHEDIVKVIDIGALEASAGAASPMLLMALVRALAQGAWGAHLPTAAPDMRTRISDILLAELLQRIGPRLLVRDRPAGDQAAPEFASGGAPLVPSRELRD